MKIILRVIFFSLLPIAAQAGLGVTAGSPVHTHSDTNSGGGTLSLSGTLSSTKACASGYARTGPNFCKRVGTQLGINVGSVSSNAACTLTTALSGVSDAKAVLLAPEFGLYSLNAVGVLGADVILYAASDTTCVTVRNYTARSAREWVATALNTAVDFSTASIVVETNTSGQFRYRSNVFSGGSSTVVTLWATGYFD